MRLFIALNIPEDGKAAIQRLIIRLQKADLPASWVQVQNMHLTLRFLGEVKETDLKRLDELLSTSLSGKSAPLLLVRGIGAFPSLRKPAVVWAGIETCEGDLISLHQAAETAARQIGLAPETRSFQPHLTLARIRRAQKGSDWESLLAPFMKPGLTPEFGEAFRPSSVLLYSSVLTPRGPVYTRLREYNLTC